MSALPLKVLVADDSRAVRGYFTEVAARSPIPFEVIEAGDGEQCLALMNNGAIQLAFIDVNMPGMSGMEAVGVTRHYGNPVFITLMSGNTNIKRLQLARQLKVYEFLTKPFPPAEVVRILKTYCRIRAPTKVLVVDDSATIRRLIAKVLAGTIFNISVTEAGDGDQALSAWQQDDFDVVFLDCNMPGLDGLATLERMVAQQPSVKVIMISGERNEQRRRFALGAGAYTFLYKPFYPADVDRELHGLFDLKQPDLAAVAPLRLDDVAPE